MIWRVILLWLLVASTRSHSEQFASTNTGPTTTVQRAFDPYGQLVAESVTNGAVFSNASQNWDASGRRTLLNIGTASYGFGWQADGSLIYASNPTGSGAYTYDTAGVLTSRSVGNRFTSITSRDGEGRPLTIATTVNALSQLGETLAWSGDGLLTNHTLVRGDFTDNRIYSYASQSRRVTQEQLNLNAGTTWTNQFVYDRGVAGGPGALTTAGPVGANFGLWWSGIPDAFSRINTETNNAIGLLAYGFVNGQSTLSAWLDSQPIQILDVGTNAMQWRTFLELSPGAHQLEVSALHPSGFYTAYATNTFTNDIPYQVTADTFDGGGNITNRVYRNASGATNRTQALSWDAKGRLREVMERNTNNYGFNWSAVYDGLNRRIATITTLVSNGVPSTVPPQVLDSYFDPQVEFLELGVTLNAAPQQEFMQPGTSPSIQTVWKLYGPDLDGTYGGLNGIGGFEGVSPYQNTFNPNICDARGNVLAEVTNGIPSWTLARQTAHGSVPGYRPVAFGNGVDFQKSSVWRGHEVDVTGYYHLGMRDYDPVSGQWLSYDPFWNAGDPNGQSFCAGDPVNFTDPDGLMTAQTMQTAGRQATTAAAFIDDQIVNVFAGTGYLMHESLGIAQQLTGGDPSTFYAQANQYQGYLSPYARQGYYNLNSPFTKIATAATIFVPGSAAGRVGTIESTLTSEASATTIAGEQAAVKQQQLLLPAPSQPLALLPENAQGLLGKAAVPRTTFFVSPEGQAIPNVAAADAPIVTTAAPIDLTRFAKTAQASQISVGSYATTTAEAAYLQTPAQTISRLGLFSGAHPAPGANFFKSTSVIPAGSQVKIGTVQPVILPQGSSLFPTGTGLPGGATEIIPQSY